VEELKTNRRCENRVLENEYSERENEMPIRRGKAQWIGTIKEGKGTVSVESGVLEAPYSFGSRFESSSGTNPEELIAAAHAGCFSMALSLMLSEAGHPPEKIETSGKVHIEKKGDGFSITRIELITEAEISGIEENEFRKHAENAKTNCPVSKALAGTEITLTAKLADGS
jgi:osmotically inducible protein OsmC